MIYKTFKSFLNSLQGLKTVLKEERNFKLEILASFGVIGFAWFFNFNISEYVPLVIMIFMVLTAEIINTAIEDLCDKVEPSQNVVIKKIKDVMAAYVLLTVICAIIVGSIVVYQHFYFQLMLSDSI